MSLGYGRRATDFPKKRLVTGLYYYIALAILAASLLTAVYWQIESDESRFELVELSLTSTPRDRTFFVPIKFCSDKIGQEITLIRYYHDVDRNIYYGVPDGKYKTSELGCFDSRVQGSTGRLEPGTYVYHVSVSYDLNPLRTVQRKVAIVTLEIQ